MDDGSSVSASTLMGLAVTAEAGGNNAEALSYYNRVLEIDPRSSDAWLGKGRAAGWSSSLGNVRTNETIVAFGHAIGSAEENAKVDVAIAARSALTSIVQALYGMAKNHWLKFQNTAGVQQTYIAVSAKLLDALAAADQWCPPDRDGLEQTVLISRDLIDLGIGDPLRTTLMTRMNEAATALEAMAPGYQRPALATQTFAEKQQAAADFNSLGVIVLFIVVVIGAIIAAAAGHH